MANLPWRLQTELLVALKNERCRLEQELRILNRAEQDLATSQAAEGGPGSPMADVASDLAQAELSASLAGTARERLIDVETALLRSAEGTYAECQACGRPIGKARLRAVPWTTHCRDCAERLGARQSPAPTSAALMTHMH